MGEMSLAFHLGSLFVLLGLIVVLLREKSSLLLWRKWGSVTASSRVEVGEPLRVLKSFARAIGCDFNSSVSLGALSPVRIQLTGLFSLHQQYGIEQIIIEQQSTPCVRFALLREPSTMTGVKDQILKELGGRFVVELLVVSK